ncbi:sensor histidine kinase [Ornithinimicrobium cerasi]|uniref:histidine kinase n=1 Tax=Ornithinimicrobium cerasi TaxID=2248773 RepID=A0A285VR69_9MICO|nr:histidine kinase [Ornithinimicrobium cerasi]SOC56535.1 Histidine kinase [Ornithinimicrobium cerasi]
MDRRTVAVALLAAAGVLPVLAVAQGWGWYLEGPLLILLAVLGGYAAGLWLPRWAAVAGGVLAVTGLVLANQLQDAEYHWIDDTVFFLVIVGGPATAGAAVALRARQLRTLEALRARLDEQERTEVAAARLEEQTRVQEQLHARLAERIAGIAVRAEGARRTVDLSQDAFVELETEARGVLDQLRAVLGSLREEPADPSVVAATDRSSRDGTDVPARDAAYPAREGAHPAREGAHPLPGSRPTRLDVALAVVLGGALAVETLVSSVARGPASANVLAALVVTAPLVLRRRRPVLAVGGTTLAAALMSLALTPVSATVTGVAVTAVVFYSVGAWCRGRSVLVGLAVAVAGTLLVGVAAGVAADEGGGQAPVVVAWGLGAAVLGRVTAGWQERVRRTEEVVAALREGRGVALRLARARERQALASELHDTVAHAMTVVCLQAGARRRVAKDSVDSVDAGATLATIAAAATSSLEELREGLDASGAGERPLDPSRVVALGRRVGVDVDVTGPAPAVTGPVATLGLRVLREALVNAARHAPGATAHVAMDGAGGSLRIEVEDDGGTGGSLMTGSGSGLVGLADTVRDAGGSLEWGPRPTGGFRVSARIPGGAPVTAAPAEVGYAAAAQEALP